MLRQSLNTGHRVSLTEPPHSTTAAVQCVGPEVFRLRNELSTTSSPSRTTRSARRCATASRTRARCSSPPARCRWRGCVRRRLPTPRRAPGSTSPSSPDCRTRVRHRPAAERATASRRRRLRARARRERDVLRDVPAVAAPRYRVRVPPRARQGGDSLHVDRARRRAPADLRGGRRRHQGLADVRTSRQSPGTSSRRRTRATSRARAPA